MSLPLWRRNQKNELDEEIRAHLEAAVRERMERGESREQAEAAARREFGNAALVAEVTHDQWGWTWLETFAQDLRYGARQLRRSPGFTLVAVLTLALGIGATTAMFSVVYGVLYRPLPFPSPSELVLVNETVPLKGREDGKVNVSVPTYVELQKRTDIFSQVAAYKWISPVWTGGDEPVRIFSGSAISANLFDVVGVRPLWGRGFLPDDAKLGAEPVVLLSHSLWQSRFGGDPRVLGRTMTLDGKSHTIIGVMPLADAYPVPTRAYPDRSLWVVWIPEEDPLYANRDDGPITVLARIAPNVSLTKARTALNLMVEQSVSGDANRRRKRGLAVTPLIEFIIGDAATTLWALFGAVGLVLLIACVNVANLLLARHSGRDHEFVVRSALGAGRKRLIRQMLTEGLLLAFAGGLSGTILANWTLYFYRTMQPFRTPRMEEVYVDAAALSFALGLSLLTVLLTSIAPALRASQVDLVEGLKETGASSPAKREGRTRAVLLVAEVAMALVLLTGAGLMMRSFLLLQAVELGFDPKNLLKATVSPRRGGTLPSEFATVSQSTSAAVDLVLARLRALPGVQAAAVSEHMPLEGTATQTAFFPGENPPARGGWRRCEVLHASAGYFETVGIPLLGGRTFTERDVSTSNPVAIVSEHFARNNWPGENAIGKKIVMLGSSLAWQIVGIVGEARYYSLTDDYHPKIYVPSTQSPLRSVTFMVRTKGDPAPLIPAVKSNLGELA